MNKLHVILPIVTILAACGGGGGGSQKPEELPVGTASGKAYDGPLANAKISASDYNTGSIGKFISSTVSDSSGDYSMNPQYPSTLMHLSTDGGSYQEEATGNTVYLNGSQRLEAVVQYSQGETVDVQLTHYTTWSTCYARYRMRELNENPINATIKANEVFTSLAGGVPITETRPVDVTKNDSVSPVLTPGHKVGFLAAGISQLVYATMLEDNVQGDSSLYTSINYSALRCQDIESDGLFNGIGRSTAGNPSGQLYLGNQPLGPFFYRTRLGQEILNFANSEQNKSGLTSSDLLEFANNIALNNHAVFAGITPSGVDQEGPTIVSSVSNGHLVSGITEIEFEITDPLGLNTVSFYLNDDLIGNGSISNPVATINTTLYADGQYTLTVQATDSLGNPSALDIALSFVNTGPGVEITSSSLSNNTAYLATGRYIENGAAINEILVNGVSATLDTENLTWEAIVPLVGGDNTVQAEAFDELGNRQSTQMTVQIDRINPVLNSNDTTVTFSDFSGQLNLCETGNFNDNTDASRPICLNAERIYLNGAEIQRGLSFDGYILIGVDIEDPQGQGVFTSISDLALEYTVTLNGQTIVEARPVPRPNQSNRTVYLPVTTEYFGDDFYTVSQTDVFEVEITLYDLAGNSDTVSFEFSLDVITPEFTITQEIQDELLTRENAFEARTALNNTSLAVEYTWVNSSMLPYYIKVDPYDEYEATQYYKGAKRENYARIVTRQEWRARLCNKTTSNGPYLACPVESSTSYWSDYTSVGVLQYYNGNSVVQVGPSVTQPNFEMIASDEIPMPQNTGWTNISSRFPVHVGCSSLRRTNGDLRHTDGRYARVVGPCDSSWSGTRTYLQERVLYNSEYADGYPKNVFSEHEQEYNFPGSSITVHNVSSTQEIIPQQGWYEIPQNTTVKITKRIFLPPIQNHLDSRVSQNGANTPYATEIFEDTSIVYSVNTDVEITRAINPGSIDDIEQVSKNYSTHGNGTVTYTVSP